MQDDKHSNKAITKAR